MSGVVSVARASNRGWSAKHVSRFSAAILVTAIVAMAELTPSTAPAAESSTAAVATAQAPTNFPLVVLTYPATISEAAFERLKGAYDQSKLGFGCSNPFAKCPREEKAFEASLAKTAYLVQDVHSSLQAKLPAGTVVLQPGSIDLSPSGQLIYSIPDPELPASVRVDFLAYVNPVIGSSDPDHHTTYGRRVAPVFVVSENQLSANGQLLAATSGLDGSVGATSAQPSTLIQLFRTVNAKADKRKPIKLKNTLKYGALKTSQAAWDQHVVGNQSTTPLAADALSPVVAPIAALARNPKLVASAEASAGRYYALFAAQAIKKPDKAAELLPLFMRTEKQYLDQTGVSFVAGLRKGQFGAAMRQRLIAEAEHSASANRTSFLSTLAVGMAGGAAGMAGGTANLTNQFLTVMTLNNELNKMSRGYSVPFGDLSASQTTVVMNVGSAELTLKAASIGELRQSFRDMLDPPPPPAAKKRAVNRKKRR